MDLPFFRSFFASNTGLSTPLSITPATFDKDTPVVVAELNGKQAGEVFGISKVKGGNRMEATHLRSMCVVFYPAKGTATAWTTI
jgi:hypothetical protein